MTEDSSSDIPFFDAVVAGAGLGGLSTALHLLRRGFTVAVVEQAERVGGLCGTQWIDGREYVIACNDFGAAMPRWLEEMGVKIRFEPYRTCIFHEGRRFHVPPKLPDLMRLLPHAVDVLRYVRALKAARRNNYINDRTLAELVGNSVRNAMVADLLKLPAYLMGVSPEQLRVDALNDEVEFGYGYFQPMVPEGGPQALVNQLAAKIREHGTIMLATRYLGFRAGINGEKLVHTSRGPLRCRYLVEAIATDAPYPGEFPSGLPLSMYCLALSPRFRYPPGVHTYVYYPKGISDWFQAIEQGELPAAFGFHVFNSHLVSPEGEYTMNLYFYLPRGIDAPDAKMRRRVEEYLFYRLEVMLPGIGAAIRDRHFLSPRDFQQRHAMSSRVLPVITSTGYAKPGNYCQESDTYRAGAAFYPPGDHGGAAVLSGRFVADLIDQARSRITTSAGRPREEYEARSA